ncbi:uncharacterized protein F5891DRAFT_1002281 [Suillus fuscotomentosus]|uniref:Uncharacterized protein n=1 Tax=Suillus fuscotomentosus TaxID=1912939 RepID=A0AAD4EK18_9AGAM|nr:uncharacterized protein F5891DRAFT_1002281 [Suillus fuscotomentosus]KAG1906423.1 hypothetical protein F5891DRAFT_1002281 [Suillus fuscotomentosus]
MHTIIAFACSFQVLGIVTLWLVLWSHRKSFGLRWEGLRRCPIASSSPYDLFNGYPGPYLPMRSLTVTQLSTALSRVRLSAPYSGREEKKSTTANIVYRYLFKL